VPELPQPSVTSVIMMTVRMEAPRCAEPGASRQSHGIARARVDCACCARACADRAGPGSGIVALVRIGIVGAGSIGCYVAGKLIAAQCDVVLVGRPRIRDELAAHGLVIEDMGGARTTVTAAVATELGAVAACDAILCCVKSGQTEEVARGLASVIAPTAVIASLQNGVHNADVLREHLPGRGVVAGIVSFNVRSRGEGVFQRATSGPIMLERIDAASQLADTLARAGIAVEQPRELVRHQWTKLLVNLNNAVSALSDAPTRQLLLSPGFRHVIAALVREALGVLRVAKLRPAPLRGVPVSWMPIVLRLPTPIVRLVTRSQMKVDPDARSSMWEDLARGRPTEVDYLNGEIVSLAARHGLEAPINRRIVELVHAAEGTGSPGLTAEALWAALRP
jgi:2-dehydropantoate 2-reductase